jgi:tetratricopeptide (TPR) repeat protein
MAELRWYLESFLDFPFPPATGRADRVLKALGIWGLEAFEALFRTFSADEFFSSSTAAARSGLRFEIFSHDPAVLSWPWEALRSPQFGPVAAASHISRRVGWFGIDKSSERPPRGVSRPDDRVNILLVVPRPFGAADIRYRSIARSLVELIETEDLPARVDILRPPMIARLREHLDQRPGYYHILHFDGHGSYSGGARPEGHLVFETLDGAPDPIGAAQLSNLLQNRLVPGVVLNACQSAMIGPGAESAFASVAAALVSAGVRSVVAMSYALYVSGARELLPAFYGALFEKGSMDEAVRSGRTRMRAQPKRVCGRGRFELEDWIIPVLYQDEPLDLPFAPSDSKPRESLLSEDLRPQKERHDSIGRDGPILALERAMRRAPAGLLITGLGGVGKTTLAREFLGWLDATHGLGRRPFWFDMREISSAVYIIDRIGEQIFGAQFSTAPLEQKLERLTGTLRAAQFVIVWDNFESVSGIPGATIAARLSAADRTLLARFLGALDGASTKVLISSRSQETWLEAPSCWRLPLAGLDGEERWEYCELILNGLGLSFDRSDPDLLQLMNLLGGHPLAMRVILSQLPNQTPNDLAEALRTNFAALKLDTEGEAETQLVSTLRILDQAIPETLRPLLAPISLHEAYLNLDDLKKMAGQVSKAWEPAQVDELAAILVGAGLLRAIRKNLFELHPVLTGYLRSTVKPDDSWTRAFVDEMGTVAEGLTHSLVRRERPQFSRYIATLYSALAESRRLNSSVDDAVLTEGLGLWALENRELDEAERLFRQSLSDRPCAGVCQHLGMVAQGRRDFSAAEDWYRKSLDHKEQLGAVGTAETYHRLGIIAEDRRDFAAAESFYLKSLSIKEKIGDEMRMATSYHQLGYLAEKARNFDEAVLWFKKSLELHLKLGDEARSAVEYHHLGVIEQETRNVTAAEPLIRQALAINEKLGLLAAAALNYHELGIIADQAADFKAAEQWYLKSLAIKEKVGDLTGTANTYHQLGITAQKTGDFAAAREWHRKSLDVRTQLGDKYAIAASWMMLGALAAGEGNFLESGKWSVEALTVFATTNPHVARLTVENFLYAYGNANEIEKARLKEMWARANLGRFPQY